MKREEMQVTPLVTPPVTLHVTEYGDRAASTHLLLVHGFPDDQRMWEPVAESLPPEWHVITYDVRGFGRSSKPKRAFVVPHFAARRGPDRRARRDPAAGRAGAPRRPRLGLGRLLGRARRRDVGPAAREPGGVVHLGQRPLARPPRHHGLDVARPVAAAAAAPAQLVRLALPAALAPRVRLGSTPGGAASDGATGGPDHRPPALGPGPPDQHGATASTSTAPT